MKNNQLHGILFMMNKSKKRKLNNSIRHIQRIHLDFLNFFCVFTLLDLGGADQILVSLCSYKMNGNG